MAKVTPPKRKVTPVTAEAMSTSVSAPPAASQGQPETAGYSPTFPAQGNLMDVGYMFGNAPGDLYDLVTEGAKAVAFPIGTMEDWQRGEIGGPVGAAGRMLTPEGLRGIGTNIMEGAQNPLGVLRDVARTATERPLTTMLGLTALGKPLRSGMAARAARGVGSTVGTGAAVAESVTPPALAKVLGFTTGAGPESIMTAFKAGQKGGPTLEAFQSSRTGGEDKKSFLRRVMGKAEDVSEAEREGYVGRVKGDIEGAVKPLNPPDPMRSTLRMALNNEVSQQGVVQKLDDALSTLTDAAEQDYLTRREQMVNHPVDLKGVRQGVADALVKKKIIKFGPNKNFGELSFYDTPLRYFPEQQEIVREIFDDIMTGNTQGIVESVDNLKKAIGEKRRSIPDRKSYLHTVLGDMYGAVRAELGNVKGYNEMVKNYEEFVKVRDEAKNLLRLGQDKDEAVFNAVKGLVNHPKKEIREAIFNEVQKASGGNIRQELEALDIQKNLTKFWGDRENVYNILEKAKENKVTPENIKTLNEVGKILLGPEYGRLAQEFGSAQKVWANIKRISESGFVGDEDPALGSLARIVLDPTDDAVHQAVISSLAREIPNVKETMAGYALSPRIGQSYIARRLEVEASLGRWDSIKRFMLGISAISPRLVGKAAAWTGKKSMQEKRWAGIMPLPMEVYTAIGKAIEPEFLKSAGLAGQAPAVSEALRGQAPRP